MRAINCDRCGKRITNGSYIYMNGVFREELCDDCWDKLGKGKVMP